MTSARVLIRPPEKGDTAEFLDAVAASRDLHHPWVFPAATTRAFHAYVRTRKRVDQFGVLVRTITDDRLVGVINVNNIVLGGMRSGALGYYAFADAAGKGLMADGMALVLDHAFASDGLALHRLEANIQPGNLPSRRLVERLGFDLEGFSPKFLFIDGDWRDHDRWAITADAWRRR
ncbi:MAG: GNAT family protein [Actinomycetota bacterium]